MIDDLPRNLFDGCHGRHHEQQTSVLENLAYFLDGAHTPESMQACAQWFCDVQAEIYAGRPETVNDDTRNVLVFNCMEERDPSSLLGPLAKAVQESNIEFSAAYFVPNDSSRSSLSSAVSGPQTTPAATLNLEKELPWQHRLQTTWDALLKQRQRLKGVAPPDASKSVHSESFLSNSLAGTLAVVHDSARRSPKTRVQVLVTGSLHLVGDVLRLLKRVPL